jgi:chemotaxis protein CheX
MRAEYINPFLTSMISVFDTMLGCKLSRGTPYVKNSVQPEHEISGVVGLSGRAKGVVVLSFCREAALAATEALLGERPKEIGPEVVDAIGELANIVTGNAKAKLEHLNLSMSLPTIVVGKWHAIEFPNTILPICIPFECAWGSVVAMVSLVEETASGRISATTGLVVDPAAAPQS